MNSGPFIVAYAASEIHVTYIFESLVTGIADQVKCRVFFSVFDADLKGDDVALTVFALGLGSLCQMLYRRRFRVKTTKDYRVVVRHRACFELHFTLVRHFSQT